MAVRYGTVLQLVNFSAAILLLKYVLFNIKLYYIIQLKLRVFVLGYFLKTDATLNMFRNNLDSPEVLGLPDNDDIQKRSENKLDVLKPNGEQTELKR